MSAHTFKGPSEGSEQSVLSVTICIRRSLEQAGISPEEVNYVNAHATSTQVCRLTADNLLSNRPSQPVQSDSVPRRHATLICDVTELPSYCREPYVRLLLNAHQNAWRLSLVSLLPSETGPV